MNCVSGGGHDLENSNPHAKGKAQRSLRQAQCSASSCRGWSIENRQLVTTFRQATPGSCDGGLGRYARRAPLPHRHQADCSNDHGVHRDVAPLTGTAVANRLDPGCSLDEPPHRGSRQRRKHRDWCRDEKHGQTEENCAEAVIHEDSISRQVRSRRKAERTAKAKPGLNSISCFRSMPYRPSTAVCAACQHRNGNAF